MRSILRWFWYLLPANPMVVRIVQGGSRRTRHLLIRVGYLGVLIALVLIALLSAGGIGVSQSMTGLAKSGATVFQWVSYGQVVFICLLAPLFMAGAIAAEQSGQTYNILLTTPLTNPQIVLGSLLGRLFFVWTLLLSGLPLFAIVLVFGGVPMASVFVSFAVAGLSALMVGSVAITLAVLRMGGRKAVFGFVVAVAAYLVATYALDTALRPKLEIAPGATTWLTPLHPLLVLKASLNSADYRVPAPETVAHHPAVVAFYAARPFAAFAALTVVLSFLLVSWSAIRLRVVGTRELGGGGAFSRRVRGWLRLGEPGEERRRKPREVWHNPIAWREGKTRGNAAAAILGRLIFCFAGVAAGAAAVFAYHTGVLKTADEFQQVFLTLLLVELAIILIVAAYMSAGAVTREREDGTLDLLLTTPITPKQYIWGKLRGLVSFLAMLMAVPILTTAIVSVYMLVGEHLRWPTASFTRTLPGSAAPARFPLILPEAPILMAMMLVPAVAALVVFGMQRSIKSKTVLAAVIWTVAVMSVFLFFTSLCGYQSAENIPFIGPAINAFSPVTNILMVIDPWARVHKFADDQAAGRVTLVFASFIAALGYSAIVYSFQHAMIQSFDREVRKLTGASS